MKKTMLCCNLTFLMFFISYGQQKKDNLNEIIAAANNGLLAYLEKIPVGKESLYGFNSREEFSSALIGKPYQVNTLSPDFLTDIELSAAKNYLSPIGEYRASIMVNGECKAFLTVAQVNGSWKVVGLGASGMAKELGQFEKQHPNSIQSGNILRVYPLQADFVLIDNVGAGQNTAYPLSSGVMALENLDDKKSSYSLFQLLQLIKTSINKGKN